MGKIGTQCVGNIFQVGKHIFSERVDDDDPGANCFGYHVGALAVKLGLGDNDGVMVLPRLFDDAPQVFGVRGGVAGLDHLLREVIVVCEVGQSLVEDQKRALLVRGELLCDLLIQCGDFFDQNKRLVLVELLVLWIELAELFSDVLSLLDQ